MAPKDKRATRASAAAAAAAQNANINDDDDNDDNDDDVEILETPKKRKIDDPIDPPKIKLNLEMKNLFLHMLSIQVGHDQ